MSRSAAKGPYIDAKLLAKVMKAQSSGAKIPIKTWARSCSIPPEFVGITFLGLDLALFLQSSSGLLSWFTMVAFTKKSSSQKAWWATN